MSHLGTVSQSWNEAESSTRAASCLPYWAMAPASYSKPSVESTWSWSSQGVDNLSHLLVLSGRRLEMVPFLVTTSRDRKTPEFLSLIPEIYEQTLDIIQHLCWCGGRPHTFADRGLLPFASTSGLFCTVVNSLNPSIFFGFKSQTMWRPFIICV